LLAALQTKYNEVQMPIGLLSVVLNQLGSAIAWWMAMVA
jgi:hypothetical protein